MSFIIIGKEVCWGTPVAAMEGRLMASVVLGCSVPGCPNEVVRTLGHKDDPSVKLRLCAFHVRRAILYLTPDQIRSLVLPGIP